MKLRVIFTAVFFIFQLQGWAQSVLDAQVKLELSGTCMLDTKDVKGLAIHLYKSGKVIDTIQNQASFAFELDYKSNYRMVINKPGFQRKILAINTGHVSIKRWNKGFHEFRVNPKLEFVKHGKDTDPMKAMPDALIAFDSEIDDFNFSK